MPYKENTIIWNNVYTKHAQNETTSEQNVEENCVSIMKNIKNIENWSQNPESTIITNINKKYGYLKEHKLFKFLFDLREKCKGITKQKFIEKGTNKIDL